ncbi:(2Fe-2S) ferredoxin domain-containing protein [Alistipes sp.]|uniref:(2Fe-2S) ferredoxin domain-containing protein n=1 Tax=Alistipes sp. TaxID=1872444 RepID=UPI003AF1AC7B
MNKVRTLEELRKMRERLHAELNIRENSNHPDRLPQVRVAMGTCGIAAGAKEVMDRFVSSLAERRIDAVVTQSGCMGYCNAEPTVEITLPGREPIVFGDVTTERVEELIDKYILTGELVDGIIPARHNTRI